MPERQKFEWHDYLIMALTLAITMAIGLVSSCRRGKGPASENSYFMADRNLRILPVTLSMLVSYISGTIVIGNTAEMYQHGLTQSLTAIGGFFAFGAGALFFVPLFFPLKITTSFQYLDMRFKSKCVRLMGVLLLVISLVFFMGISVFSPGIALAAVTDIPLTASIIVIGAVGTLYTTIGGMRAVIWTDAFQAIVLIGGVLAVVIEGTIKAGGISAVWQRAEVGGRLTFVTDFSPMVRASVWSVVVGHSISALHLGSTSQTSMQRYCSLRTTRDAQWAVFLHYPFFAGVIVVTTLAGLVVYSYFDSIGCDILRTPAVANQNQLLSYFILNVVRVPALPGIFAAVLISGSLSTVSSSVNSLSAVAWKDIIEPHSETATQYRSFIIKGLSVLFGGLGIGFAFCVAEFGGHVFQLAVSFFSGVGGPICGLFILGGFFPFAEWIGAFTGAIIGLILGLWVIFGNALSDPYQGYIEMTVENCTALGFNASDIKPMPRDNDEVFEFYKMSYLWYPAFGTVITVVVGAIVSALVQITTDDEEKEELHPSLIIPFFDRLFCCLSENIRRKLRCNIAHDSVKYDECGFVIYPPLHEEETHDENGIHGIANEACVTEKMATGIVVSPSIDENVKQGSTQL